MTDTRKRSRSEAHTEKDIPNVSTLHEMTLKAFKTGDHFSQWRGRYFRTFASSYTASLVSDCLQVLRNKETVEVGFQEHIRRFISQEIDTLQEKNAFINLICQDMREYLTQQTRDFDICIRHAFQLQTGELKVLVPLAQCFMENNSLWRIERQSYFEKLKYLFTIIQESPLFVCTSAEAGLESYKSSFYDFIAKEDSIECILQKNIDMHKDLLHEMQTRKLKMDENNKKQIARISSNETEAQELQREKANMESKLTDILNSNTFNKIIGDISQTELIDYQKKLKQIFGEKFSKIEGKIGNLKMENEIAKQKIKAKEIELIQVEVDSVHRQIRLLENIMANRDVHDKTKKNMILEFDRSILRMKPVFDILTEESENVKMIVKWLSSIISSKTMVLENISSLASQITDVFQQNI